MITAVASFGAVMAYIYSAPPLKLKAEGWLGTYALGSSYVGSGTTWHYIALQTAALGEAGANEW